MLRVFADDVECRLCLATRTATTPDDATLGTDGLAGWTDFHTLWNWGRGWRRRGWRSTTCSERTGLSSGRESIDDAPLREIVGRHFQADTVPGEDPDAVHPHPTGQVAQKNMILRLLAGHADAKRGIGEALLHNADKFDHVLGHIRGKVS